MPTIRARRNQWPEGSEPTYEQALFIDLLLDGVPELLARQWTGTTRSLIQEWRKVKKGHFKIAHNRARKYPPPNERKCTRTFAYPLR